MGKPPANALGARIGVRAAALEETDTARNQSAIADAGADGHAAWAGTLARRDEGANGFEAGRLE